MLRGAATAPLEQERGTGGASRCRVHTPERRGIRGAGTQGKGFGAMCLFLEQELLVGGVPGGEALPHRGVGARSLGCTREGEEGNGCIGL